MVSESKVRVISSFIASQMLLTKSGGEVVSVVIGLTCPLMHARTHTYTLAVQRWKNSKRPSAFKGSFSSRWHWHLLALGVCFNGPQEDARFYLGPNWRRLRKKMCEQNRIVFLLNGWIFSIYMCGIKNLDLHLDQLHLEKNGWVNFLPIDTQ